MTPEAETPEPVEATVAAAPDETLIDQFEREHPEEMAVARATHTPPKGTPRKRKPKTKAVPEAPAEFCDNHPDKPAVFSSTRGGKIRLQRFCAKCQAKLPLRYSDG